MVSSLFSSSDPVESFIDPLLGRSLRACRDVSAGQVIFKERAWLNWSSTSDKDGDDDIQLATSGNFDRLLVSTVKAYLKASKENDDFSIILKEFMFEQTAVDEYEQQVRDIVSDSSFASLPVSSVDLQELLDFVGVCYTNAHSAGAQCGLFRLASQMNHSCSPNCIFYMDDVSVYQNNSDSSAGCSHDDEGIFNIQTTSDSVQLIFKASRDIKAGEELLCSYLGECDLLLPFALRRLRLIRTKYFECQCHRCLQESGSAMYQLIEDYSPVEMKLYCDSVDRPLAPEEIIDLFQLLVSEKSGDLNLSVFVMLRFGNTLIRMMESLPPASVQLARLNELSVIASWIFFSRLSELLRSVHPMLLIKWIHGEPVSGSLIPCWSKWIEILRESPHMSNEPDEPLPSLEYWLGVLSECWQDPMKMNGTVRISPTAFIRDLSRKTWEMTRKAARAGLLNVSSSGGSVTKKDLQYFKDCRR